MAAICDECNVMSLCLGYHCEQSAKLPVTDVRYPVLIRVNGVTVDGAQSLDRTITGLAYGFCGQMLRTIVARAVPRVIDDDIVARLNVRVINETVEHVYDVGSGRCNWFIRRGGNMGAKKALNTLFGNADILNQGFSHQFCV